MDDRESGGDDIRVERRADCLPCLWYPGNCIYWVGETGKVISSG